MNVYPPKWFVGGRKASHGILRPYGTFWSSNRGSSLLIYEVIGEVAFWPFLVIDLTSEVTGWPRTLNSGVNDFVWWQATRCFCLISALAQSGTKREGVASPPPLVPWRMAKWRVPARVNIACRICQMEWQSYSFVHPGFCQALCLSPPPRIRRPCKNTKVIEFVSTFANGYYRRKICLFGIRDSHNSGKSLPPSPTSISWRLHLGSVVIWKW